MWHLGVVRNVIFDNFGSFLTNFWVHESLIEGSTESIMAI